MVELYEAGLSTNIVGRLMGRHKATVKLALERQGVALRPVHVAGPANKLWKGCTRDRRGYVYVRVLADDPMYVMGRRVFEHRLVMARHLGRPLLRNEHVHHINGVRADNRIENLQLVQVGHPAGVRLQCLACGSHRVEPVKVAA